MGRDSYVTWPIFMLFVIINSNINIDFSLTDSLNFFTGGPVWCAVWCPIPTTEGVNADQYMAVYSHKHMDETNVVKKAFTKTTVIQIWNCGPLNAFSEYALLNIITFLRLNSCLRL